MPPDLPELTSVRTNRIFFPAFRPDLNQTVLRFGLRFPLENPRVTQDMVPYLTGMHHISLKQVPSTLILKKAGSSSVKKNCPVLLDAGFCIEEYSSSSDRKFLREDENGKVMEIPDPYRPSVNIGTLLGFGSDSEAEGRTLNEEISDKIQEELESEGKTNRKKSFQRLVYGDFFRIIAGRFLYDLQGSGEGPVVRVWSGDVKRLTDPLNPNLFEWKRHGLTAPKNPIRFQDVKSTKVKIDFLRFHTHWGYKLYHMCKEEVVEGKPCKTPQTFWRVLEDYLDGKPDPRWTNEFTAKVYADPTVARSKLARASRLLEVLKTVDGVFAQRFCAFPHEDWTYEKFDVFVLRVLWEMISDEFLDGELTKFGRSLVTRFSELKSARGEFKHATSRGKVADLHSTDLFRKQARWLRFLLPLYKSFEMEQDRMRKIYLHGVLCQTRGAGKPPPVCKLQAKEKFLLVTTMPDDIDSVRLRIIKQAMDEVLSELPDHVFTGLTTKGGITVNTSACFEYTQEQGGTLLAIQDICKKREAGHKVKTFDLETGKPDGLVGDEVNPGTYIFWACLQEVLSMAPSKRSEVTLVVVSEPGKDRAITKARACLKIVLDWINKICAVPLEKGFDSSHSGMRLSNHAWNLFKDSESEPLRDILFKIKDSKKVAYNGSIRVTTEYETVYAVSTDYETATDYQSHKVGRIIGYAWMLKCGIPRVLRNLVCEVAFNPRTIYYHGNLGIGDEVNSEENLWKITTSRGVLMGDPLTKIILHFDNIVARRLSYRLLQEDFYTRAFGITGSNHYENLKSKLFEKGIDLDLLPKLF